MADMEVVRRGLREVDFVLNSNWRLGRNIVAGWTFDKDKLQLCFAEPYKVLSQSDAHPRLTRGRRLMGTATFEEACKVLAAKPVRVQLPFGLGQRKDDVNPVMIENVVRRYSVMQTMNRGVILFDIVGFSKFSPTEQVAQLSSLEYSINKAAKRMTDEGLRIELARTTVGDGFYVWNRAKGLDGDLRTYTALMLMLADNAIARQKGKPGLVPTLRTCFCIGPHFSYHQVEGANPRGFEFIVGDVTIKLARMIGAAMANQVLIGHFTRPADGANVAEVDTINFMARAEKLMSQFHGSEMSGSKISRIRASITGGSATATGFSVKLYSIPDKHGFRHDVVNARVQIERDGADAIAIGLLEKDIAPFIAEAEMRELTSSPGSARPSGA